MRKLRAIIYKLIPKRLSEWWYKHTISITYSASTYPEVYEWCKSNLKHYSLLVSYGVDHQFVKNSNGAISMKSVVKDNKIIFRFHNAEEAVMFKLRFADLLFEAQ